MYYGESPKTLSPGAFFSLFYRFIKAYRVEWLFLFSSAISILNEFVKNAI